MFSDDVATVADAAATAAATAPNCIQMADTGRLLFHQGLMNSIYFFSFCLSLTGSQDTRQGDKKERNQHTGTG